MFLSKPSLKICSLAVLLFATIRTAKASDMDTISQKCGLAETAQNAGKLDDAEQNLIDALQISWKIPLANSKPPTSAEKARIASMTQDEKIALANKEYSDSLSDVVLMSIPMALGQLCDSYEKAGQFAKVVEIHEWLVKNDAHRGGDIAEIDIAANQIMMAKAALQANDKKKSDAYYACAIADETNLKSKMTSGQLQNFAGFLKDYSEVLKTTGAPDDAAKVMLKSQEYSTLANQNKAVVVQ